MTLEEMSPEEIRAAISREHEVHEHRMFDAQRDYRDTINTLMYKYQRRMDELRAALIHAEAQTQK